METYDNELSSQQLMETSAEMLNYCESKQDERLKVEMTPLQDASGQKECTVLAITSDQHPVQDHLIWSIFNTIYMNFCCLGFIALIFSVKSRDQKLNGKQSQARQYSTSARYLNIFSTVLTILWFLITVSVIIYNFVRLKAAIRNFFGK